VMGGSEVTRECPAQIVHVAECYHRSERY
jgi:hypothetical protein